jgi:D-alanine-D-alanine ligase
MPSLPRSAQGDFRPVNSVRNVAVFFGGRSVEHEVSVVTAMQALAALPVDRFHGIPVYISKQGTWHSGDALRELEAYRDIERLLSRATHVTLRPEPQARHSLLEVASKRGLLAAGRSRSIATIDAALPLIHGSHGEDGTLQGLFELCDLAYAGCRPAAAAISMDKRLSKAVLRSARLPVLDDVVIDRAHWRSDAEAMCVQVESTFASPHFVKPLSLGSSIGVTRVETREQLRDAVDTALTYDLQCLVEPAQEDIIEINCAVLGRGRDLRTSVCEQPVAAGTLTYADKYLSKPGSKSARTTGMKGSQRLIPAPIPVQLTQRIRDAAATAFHAIGAEGVARVDFLVRPESGWFAVNELNTVPGSLAFYLWEPAGITFPDLLTRLIEMGLERAEEKRGTTFSIDSWLLRGEPG